MKPFLLVLIPTVVQSKVVTGSVRLNGVNTEEEMAKFSFPVGRNNSVTIQVWVENEQDADYVKSGSSLSLYGFIDESWSQVRKATTCSEKIKLSRWRSGVRAQQGLKTVDPLTSKYLNRIYTMRRSVLTQDRTHVWYFMLADCTLEQYFHDNTIPIVHYRVEMLQWDGSQLPVSERGVGILHFFNILISSALFFWLVIQMKRSLMNDGVYPHAANATLGLASLLDVLSSLCEFGHVTIYSSNGIGSYFLDALAAQFEAGTDAAIAFLFFTIGAGWTLRASLALDNKNRSNDLKPNASILQNSLKQNIILIGDTMRRPLIFPKSSILFFIVHLALAQWSRIYNDDFDTFHDFEHLPGRILVLLRLCMATLFIPIVLRTQRCASERLRRFLACWTALGTMWFLQLPLLVILATRFPTYARHRLVSGIGAIIQSLALAGLVALFTGAAKSYYLAVSTVARPDAELDFSHNDNTGGIESGFSHATFGDPDLRFRSSGKLTPSSHSNLATNATDQPSALKFGKLKIRVD